MALATYKDLCIDAVDPAVMAPFWQATLGLEADPDGVGRVTHLTGPTEQHGVWINRVPEPVTVKQRVHIDVHAGSVDEVLVRGAAALDLESFKWKVLRDPEGGELCVFVRDEVPAYRLYELVVDSAEPREIATWWADVLGGRLGERPEEGEAWVEEIPGLPFESIDFVPVPEPKTVKNRIHWDVDTADVELLVGAGASVVRAPDDEISWTVMADPEGNEFCAFVATA
jgi:Glyoxalase-like domain